MRSLLSQRSTFKRILSKKSLSDLPRSLLTAFLSLRNRIYPTSELKEHIAALLSVDAINYTTPSEFVERNSHFFFIGHREEYKRGPSNGILTENTAIITDRFQEILPGQWGESSLREAFENMADTLSMKLGQDSNQSAEAAKASRVSVQHFLRWALTGGRPGPTLMLTMSILGRDVSLKRIKDAAAVLERMEFEANESSA